MTRVISVENISKFYKLGSIGGSALRDDVSRWWAYFRGLPDPLRKVGETNHGNQNGSFIWALKDLSLEVKQGEVLGIIGRNGAGKSTLLKILSQVTAPTAGQVKIRGRIASLLEVGTGFHPELTGRENIFLNGTILGMTKHEIQRKLDEIIEFAGVEKFIETPVKRYSSGMYVRLAFAIAAHLDPEILIVDEVLAVGDAEFQKKSLGKMQDVSQNQGRTVLFVSHNLISIANLCKSGLYLSKGKLSLSGPIAKVLAAYSNDVKRESHDSSSIEKRGGSGGEIIKDVWIQDSCGNPIQEVVQGEKIRFSFSAQVPESYRNLNVGFAINSEDGTRIFTTTSDWEGFHFSPPSSSFSVTCHVPELPLIPGLYFLSVALIFQMDTLDCRENCLKFEVVSSGNQLFPNRGADQGFLYMRCNFEFKN